MRWAPPLWASAIFVTVFAIALRTVSLPQSAVDALFVLPFGLLIWSSAVADMRGVPSILHRRWATYAGEVSFAFYLVHELVIMNLIPLLGQGAGTLTGAAFSLLAFVVAALAAAALHHLVELPAQSAIRRRFSKSPQGA